MAKEGLLIGGAILSALGIFLIVELFAGGAPVQVINKTPAPAPNPGGYGSTGGNIAKTANQAANVMNTVAGDVGQVAPDINSILSSINSIGNQDSFESFENEREGADSFESFEENEM